MEAMSYANLNKASVLHMPVSCKTVLFSPGLLFVFTFLVSVSSCANHLLRVVSFFLLACVCVCVCVWFFCLLRLFSNAMDFYSDHTLGVIGGPQGPKSLLDAVRQAVKDGNIDTLNRLSKEFLSVNDNVSKCVDENGDTIAHCALDKNTITLQYVIDTLHANVNAVNNQGRTPLHEAVTQNYVECCEVLLESGADDSVQSATQSTPFHTAAACGSVECMEIILKHSENPTTKVNEVDRQRSSALHKCAFDGDVRVSRWLVEHGATVDAVDLTDATPLLIAVKMGQAAVVQYLLSQGADCNKQDSSGNCGLHYCAIRCDTVIADMLVKAGANPCFLNDAYNNPLHVAALRPRPDSREWERFIGMMLMAGCDPLQLNASKKIPSDYVGRSLKKLFSKEEVERRAKEEAAAQQALEAELDRAIAMCDNWRATVKKDVDARRELEAAEDNYLAKETEANIRAAGDARMAYEEAVETCRFQEEEIKRKKAALEKANAKGGR